jgi:hypothetical protein
VGMRYRHGGRAVHAPACLCHEQVTLGEQPTARPAPAAEAANAKPGSKAAVKVKAATNTAAPAGPEHLISFERLLLGKKDSKTFTIANKASVSPASLCSTAGVWGSWALCQRITCCCPTSTGLLPGLPQHGILEGPCCTPQPLDGRVLLHPQPLVLSVHTHSGCPAIPMAACWRGDLATRVQGVGCGWRT